MKPKLDKLDLGQRHFLRLLKRDGDVNGWCKISDNIFPYIEQLPSELVEVNDNVARLTEIGNKIVEWSIGKL